MYMVTVYQGGLGNEAVSSTLPTIQCSIAALVQTTDVRRKTLMSLRILS